MESPLCNSVFTYCVETLPRLKSVQVSLLTSQRKLSLTDKSVFISAGGQKTGEDKCMTETECTLDSCQLDLSSCRNVRLVSDVLCLRFNTSIDVQEFSIPCDVLESTNPQLSEIRLVCAFCGLNVTTPDNAFKRVLPLPSEAWEEFSGSVYCHYHGHHGDKFKGKENVKIISPSTVKIVPRDGDCLTSTSVLLVTDTALDMQHVHKAPLSQNIYCKRCLLFLGNHMTSESRNDVATTSVPISLQRSNICVQIGSKPSCLFSSIARLEDYFARRLFSFAHSKMVFRYSVKDSAGHYHVHIWMLNVCCQLMHNSDPDVLKRFSGCCENKTGRSMMVLKLLFKFILVIIIYLLLIMPLIKDTSSAEYNHYDVCSGISDDGKSINVQESDLEMTPVKCLKLNLLLAHSNKSLPPGQRKASGYNVGYLQYLSRNVG